MARPYVQIVRSMYNCSEYSKERKKERKKESRCSSGVGAAGAIGAAGASLDPAQPTVDVRLHVDVPAVSTHNTVPRIAVFFVTLSLLGDIMAGTDDLIGHGGPQTRRQAPAGAAGRRRRPAPQAQASIPSNRPLTYAFMSTSRPSPHITQYLESPCFS